jgi:hypothetical protein
MAGMARQWAMGMVEHNEGRNSTTEHIGEGKFWSMMGNGRKCGRAEDMARERWAESRQGEGRGLRAHSRQLERL